MPVPDRRGDGVHQIGKREEEGRKEEPREEGKVERTKKGQHTKESARLRIGGSLFGESSDRIRHL